MLRHDKLLPDARVFTTRRPLYHLSTFLSAAGARTKLLEYAHPQPEHWTRIDLVAARIEAGCGLGGPFGPPKSSQVKLSSLLTHALTYLLGPPKSSQVKQQILSAQTVLAATPICVHPSPTHPRTKRARFAWIQGLVRRHLPNISARGLARSTSARARAAAAGALANFEGRCKPTAPCAGVVRCAWRRARRLLGPRDACDVWREVQRALRAKQATLTVCQRLTLEGMYWDPQSDL